MVRVEDFDRFAFIVGAPRCGTTTLAQFLKGHASVSFPCVKEPHYFAQHDLRSLSQAELRRRVEGEYLRRYFREDGRGRVGADASVTYLYLPEQLEPVLRLWPDSRFVVALRNPLSMLPSLHRRLIYLGDESIPDFREAWAAIPERAAGHRVPRRCADPRWLRYDLAAHFGAHLERLFAAVGRERCHVVIFDDLAANPAGEYRRFMRFLGIDPVLRPDFSAKRPGKSVRSRWLQRMLKRPPAAVRGLIAGDQYLRRVRPIEQLAEPKPAGRILSLRKRLLEWNRVTRPLEPLPLDLQLQIRDRLGPDVERLSRLLDRDLTHWLNSDGSHAPMDARQAEPVEEIPRAAFSH